MGVVETAHAIAAGAVRASDVAAAALARIDAFEGDLHAFLHVDRTGALAAAERVDADRRAGLPLGPLAGVPVHIKDMIAVAGMPLTAGSKMLAGWTPPLDATVVARLRAAGAVLIGKTNQDEFAMGSSNENSAFGPSRNPWDRTRVAGGSSGGAAAATAAGLGCGGLGTDTGGSVRQPAALCGVVGFKPTWGRVSRAGVVAFASSLDQVGTLTRSVADAAALYTAIAGSDPLDATSDPRPVADCAADLTEAKDLRGVRLGVPIEYLDAADGLDAGVRQRIEEALATLAQRGADVRRVSLPHVRFGIAAYYLVCTAEASANLQRYDGVRFGHRAALAPGATLDSLYATSRGEGFGPEVKRRILLGTFALSAGFHDAYYRKACQVRRLVHDDFARALRDCDALVGPTSPVCAWPLGAHAHDPLAMYLMDIFTVSANLAGLPALSVPAAPHPASALPVGLQFVGRAFDEASLLRVAHAFEAARGPCAWPAPAARSE
ncbi:MAG: Asp-tRNA(Asn)/Glu-tRNA(Gln) amidotransferase subunit GatA [Myxococcales bacterium]|nr:Asp-tRNA(Asn)/Glu-tRNA(Gln) amidotransferase subunit GatA [Myxococcales bacterium]